MAKWRTDPSFQYAPQTNKPSNPASMQSNLRVSTRKTDVSTSDEKQVCPIHGTNHDLNECRAFRQKPMTERMDLLKKNRLCFRCCSLQKHLQRSCRENVQKYLSYDLKDQDLGSLTTPVQRSLGLSWTFLLINSHSKCLQKKKLILREMLSEP
ncbi:unnamed protein product [Mytilus edulis]|uniref:Uncharacterized protein n=1 Tax=Mytilus edulis TaxID=6550 RepID=A0A8S3SQM0_MYTED|nr:unnamed protein product [Mytilus edulis]